MINIKPFHVVFQDKVNEIQKNAVYSAIDDTLHIFGVTQHIQVFYYNHWRDNDWKNGNILKDYGSLDWYLLLGRKHSRNKEQVNIRRIFELCQNEPWQKSQAHYDIFVLAEDLNSGSAKENFVFGTSYEGLGVAVSTFRLSNLGGKTLFETTKTILIHELGHMLGATPEHRKEDREDLLGIHCTNTCVMRQGLCVPDWIRYAHDRVDYETFCPVCKKHINNYLRA